MNFGQTTEPLISDHLLSGLTGDCQRRSDGRSKAHLIGIAGAGMQALAEVLMDHDWQLSGSDADTSSLRESIASVATVNSRQDGCQRHHFPAVFNPTGHDARHVPHDADLVIYSTAVPVNNVERRRAAELALPTLSYPQALGRIFQDNHCRWAVAGTHGKSSAVAMTDNILSAARCDATVIAGGLPVGRATAGRAGRDDVALVEACEYQRNFLHLRPSAAVVLGVEPDHFECYDTTDDLVDAFRQFAARVDPTGLLIVRHDCAHAAAVAAAASCPAESFGFDSAADWRAERPSHRRGRWSFDLVGHRRRLGRIQLRVPGRHNVLNALAAAALVSSRGVGFREIEHGLSRFAGIARRLETVGVFDGVTWIDDYAHHPTEVAASLAAVRQLCPGRRLWCVFQPHQVSRTRRLLDEFAHSLQNADTIVVTEVFRAREGPGLQDDTTGSDLAAAVRRQGAKVIDVQDRHVTIEHLLERVTAGDVVLTMGAGDIRKVGNELVNRLRGVRAAG